MKGASTSWSRCMRVGGVRSRSTRRPLLASGTSLRASIVSRRRWTSCCGAGEW